MLLTAAILKLDNTDGEGDYLDLWVYRKTDARDTEKPVVELTWCFSWGISDTTV